MDDCALFGLLAGWQVNALQHDAYKHLFVLLPCCCFMFVLCWPRQVDHSCAPAAVLVVCTRGSSG